MKKILKPLMLTSTGGFIYGAVEIAYKGETHISMFLVGGLCFLLIGGLNSVFKNMTVITQMALGSVIITLLEFVCGLIVNVWLGLNVWDYSARPLNIMGQICPLFLFIWFFMSLPAILLDDFMRVRLFGEKKPNYCILHSLGKKRANVRIVVNKR